MGICFLCAKCERPLNVDAQLSGRRGKCPNCESRLEVPITSEMSEDEFRQVLTEWRSRDLKEDFSTPSTSEALDTDSKVSRSEASDPVPETGQSQPPEFSAPGEITETPVVMTESQKVSSELFARLLPHDCDILNQEPAGNWYVRPASGGQFGPADNTLLKSWISEGRVTHDSYVWHEGWADWRLASEVFISDNPSVIKMGGPDSHKTESSIQPREAYLKARKKRTMRRVVGLSVGATVVLVLIFVLIYVIQNRAS